MTTAQLVSALVVVLVVLSGIPLGRIACRRDPGPRRRHPADTRGACVAECRTCTALKERGY
ncbi:hypothetical protein GCM10010329_17200 [Streptomyces spiroverticillatus]|uniref:Uncharacterized protein n=1 Tax=Streptomyces finlayi TaxID=67296 RepID=A0A918WTN7_9ACTN|nr:hypothetical protein [Streptomyces finlayi]GGZ96546.1 hypothetical protein GCM10010329_17200 [Streptomyces spiroverticillatus]GHC81898.1 hypothetical protein GCM10010334_09680 [Streptomyces finlayi]